MDGRAAIDLNREALKRILAGLIAMAGLAATASPFSPCGRRWPTPDLFRGSSDEGCSQGNGPATLPRHLYLAVLRILRPAEAAARRLIVALARALPVQAFEPRSVRRNPKPRPTFLRNRVGTGIVLPPGVPTAAASLVPPSAASPAFSLLDPMRRWNTSPRRSVASGVPRICVPGFTQRFPVVVRVPPSPSDPIDMTRLSQRLAALASALGDLPQQARRFARWRARNDRLRDRGLVRRSGPLRMGRPPGGRLPHYDPLTTHQRNIREVDHILAHCHALAMFALVRPDTS